MNLRAFRILAAGTIFLTCSCSGPVGEEAFLETVRRAAREAGRTARILEIRGPAPDHPVALDFPEGRYLKAALLLVD
jgi:23S rRNA (cytosine1962-C5)-methyltransferase